MARLDRRIAALEAATAIDVEPIVFLISFVAPGEGDDPTEATIDGDRYLRSDDESAEQFVERLAHAARIRRRGGCAGVVFFA